MRLRWLAPLAGAAALVLGFALPAVAAGPYSIHDGQDLYVSDGSHNGVVMVGGPVTISTTWVNVGTYSGHTMYRVECTEGGTSCNGLCWDQSAGKNVWEGCQSGDIDEEYQHIGNWIIAIGYSEAACGNGSTCGVVQNNVANNQLYLEANQHAAQWNQWTFTLV